MRQEYLQNREVSNLTREKLRKMKHNKEFVQVGIHAIDLKKWTCNIYPRNVVDCQYLTKIIKDYLTHKEIRYVSDNAKK